jgi:hypothetical protein
VIGTNVSEGIPETDVGSLCKALGITRSTLYWHVSPTGEPRGEAKRQLKCQVTNSSAALKLRLP